MKRLSSEYGIRWIYLLTRSDGTLKVGVTGQPENRYEHHARRGLTWFHLGPRGTTKFAFRAEGLICTVLEAYGERSGEEFRGVDREMAVAVMRKVADAVRQEAA